MLHFLNLQQIQYQRDCSPINHVASILVDQDVCFLSSKILDEVVCCAGDGSRKFSYPIQCVY